MLFERWESDFKERSFRSQRLFARESKPNSWYSFFYETPPIELENHQFFLISDEMMYCRNGHKTYCDNLDGILQRLYVWSSMLVMAKCFATYEDILLFYWFNLRCYLNDGGMLVPHVKLQFINWIRHKWQKVNTFFWISCFSSTLNYHCYPKRVCKILFLIRTFVKMNSTF